MDELSEGMAAAAGRTYRGATIAWGRGECYDFDTPNPEIITLDDVAFALAYTVRWRGQTRVDGRRAFYGVAQHCIFGAVEMKDSGHTREEALAFLWHEPDEVVLPDFPGPAKASVPGLKEFARRQGEALLIRFAIPRADPDLMKLWDMRMMNTEKRDLMAGHSSDTFHSSDRRPISDEAFPPFERRIIPYAHPDHAAGMWIEMHRALGGGW